MTEDRRSALRSTSTPTEPVAEALPVTSDPLDAQLLNLFFDRVPMGVPVFGAEQQAGE